MSKQFRTILTLVVTVALIVSSVGCFGSFSLVKKVYNFNQGLGDKWMQEVGYLLMTVIPVYGGAAFIDAVILNSMEFWTGKNPLTSNTVTDQNGMTVAFNKADGTIAITGATDGKSYLLSKSDRGVTVQNAQGQPVLTVTANPDGSVTVTNPDGTTAATYTKAQLENLSTRLAAVE